MRRVERADEITVPAQLSGAGPTSFPRRPLLLGAIALVVIALFARWLVITPKLPDWTGFDTKTLWDVLDLIVVPLALAVVAYLFSQAQKRYELDIAARDRAADQEIAAQNRTVDQEIASSRDNEAALQSYFDRMTDLLLIHKMKQESDIAEEANRVAQARTLNTLQRLDGARKGHILQFLYSAQLVNTPRPYIDLKDADLRNAVLSSPRAELSGANYQAVHLAGADLRNAFLNAALLQNANLRNTDLRNAQLQNAVLRATILEKADLSEAKLNFAVAVGATLRRARLRGADLSGANFSSADLSSADLTDAIIDSTDLTGANLTGATLTGVDLAEAIIDRQTKLPDGALPVPPPSADTETET